jgi:hypothetical protein
LVALLAGDLAVPERRVHNPPDRPSARPEDLRWMPVAPAASLPAIDRADALLGFGCTGS